MPAINSFRFTVTLVLVVVFCMYNYRTSEPGLERTRLRRAAITKWPGTTYPLPISDEWSKLVDLNAVPDLKVRATNSESCASPDLGCTWSCNGCMAADDIKTCPDRKTLALSFDDGPSPATPALLDMLDKDNIKVTFFVVGTQLLSDTNKATLLRAFKAGHQIASHTWSHRALTTLSNQEIIAEVMWSHEIIKSVIGVAPVYIRPPYGDVDNRVRSILKQLGYHIAIWSHDTFDWQIASDPTKTAESVAADFKTWINDQSRSLGMITLEHDLYDAAVAAVPGSLAVIKESKINLMTIAKCVGRNAYVESVNETVSSSSDTPKSTPASKISSTSSTPKSADTSAASSTASVLSMGYFFVASLLFIVVAF